MATFERPFRYVIVSGSLVIYMKIYMLQTKFSVSFARRGKDEAMTVLGAVGLHITDLIFQAINCLSKKITKFLDCLHQAIPIDCKYVVI